MRRKAETLKFRNSETGIWNRLKNAASVLFNRYEAATPQGPERSYLPGLVTDARFDATSYTRWELTRKIRYFERNVWLVGKLKEIRRKYTIGPNGLPVIPASSDSVWNERALESYHEWCEAPCRDSLLTMAAVHALWSDEDDIDGEVFTLKTRRKASGQASRPALQLIESHRCSSPGQQFSLGDNESQVDGVEIDGNGRPVGYWIRDGVEMSSEWTFRKAEDVLHIFRPLRVGMYRGLTPYYAILNSLHDLDDLEMLEMERAKQNSENAFFFTSATGEFSAAQAIRSKMSGQPSTAPKADDLEKRVSAYRKVLGSRAIALKTGETVEQQANANPSAATQWYWRYKISQICAAKGIPMILVLPESMQGTVSRGVLDDAHLYFRGEFARYAHAAKDIYRYFMGWAIYNDPRLVDPPADWNKCHVVPPPRVNVDVGRNSTAMLAEVAAGTKSYDDVASDDGTIAEIRFRKKARNIGRIKQIAIEESKAMGVEIKPEEIAMPLADVIEKLAGADEKTDDEKVDKELVDA